MYGQCCDKDDCTVDGLTRHEPIIRMPQWNEVRQPAREYVQRHMHYFNDAGKQIRDMGCYWGGGEMRTVGT